MKSKFKSAFIANVGLSLMGFLLVACSEDYEMPHVFGGSEVPAEVLAEPRVVSSPSQAALNNPSWPRLGDVPAKPQNFSPKPVIDQAMDEMEFDRNEGEQISEQHKATTPAGANSYLKPPQFNPY